MKLDQKIKYMIAIRPHALSAQYLCMINQSINEIQPERLQINIIAGHIKPDEVDFGGILGTVTDASSIPDRTNYMIDYLKELRDMESNGVQIPECYVTCTNIHSLEAVAKLGYKIIFPYREYKFGYFLDKSVDGQLKPGVGFDLSDKKIMLAISPIIRDTQEEIDAEFPKNIVVHTQDGKSYLDRFRFLNDTAYFTYDNFVRFVKELESKGINEILFNGAPESERDNLIKYIKRYKETE
jgi:alkanesulfonate monooxygenase SsuD/methylene tetrahydromethanopterin reductase-like flavin-dependent oxidoreductase (luciferase family)